jgi:DNA-binding transcriptional regulator YdaS (Cro superfamily)
MIRQIPATARLTEEVKREALAQAVAPETVAAVADLAK